MRAARSRKQCAGSRTPSETHAAESPMTTRLCSSSSGALGPPITSPSWTASWPRHSGPHQNGCVRRLLVLLTVLGTAIGLAPPMATAAGPACKQIVDKVKDADDLAGANESLDIVSADLA